MAQAAKARVFMNGRSQHVTIPAEFRFTTDEVYVQRDAKSGVLSLSEKPLRPSMAEIFAKLDEAGAADFVLERDLSLPTEREIFLSPTSFYMLDTNTASYLVNGRSPEARRTYLETEPHAGIAISAITEAEIRFGLEKKPEAVRLRNAFEEFFEAIQILPWDSEVARAYGKLRAGASATGKSLSLMDLLIASHAIAAGAILVSHDQAFQHVTPFLTVVDWATDL